MEIIVNCQTSAHVVIELLESDHSRDCFNR